MRKLGKEDHTRASITNLLAGKRKEIFEDVRSNKRRQVNHTAGAGRDKVDRARTCYTPQFTLSWSRCPRQSGKTTAPMITLHRSVNSSSQHCWSAVYRKLGVGI